MVTAPETFDVCGFRVGEHCFAVASATVAEVLSNATIAPVPLAPPAIAGLVHLRGRIVPVIDLRPPDRPDRAAGRPVHLVLRLAEDWYSLLVDEVLDVQAIPAAGIEQPVKPGGGPAAEAVTGVFAAADRLMHILDPERLVQALQRHKPSPLVRHGDTHGG